jgi:GAF domain-containing protein
MSVHSAWSVDDYVYSGTFSSPQDLDSAVLGLARQSSGIAVIATYSGYYLLPRLSRVVVDMDLRSDILIVLRDRLQGVLRLSADAMQRAQAVEEAIRDLVPDRIQHAQPFGEATHRAGALGVMVARGELLSASSDVDAQSNVAAMTVMCSRFAAFHRENSQELNVRAVYKSANKTVSEDLSNGAFGLAELAKRITGVRLASVLDRARELVDAESILIYEFDNGRLVLAESSPSLDMASHDTPRFSSPLATAGEEVLSVDDLVDKCWNENRKLYSVLPCGGACVGWPYGAPRSVGGLGGVVAITFSDAQPYAFDLYSMSLMNSTVRHVERALTERGRLWSVEHIDQELRRIGAGIQDGVPGPEPMNDSLADRRDLKLTMPTIARMLDYLAFLTGSLSVTFRLLSGTDEGKFSRGLLCVYCSGEGCDIESPAVISLDDAARSVNAYVATHGVPVYLRWPAESLDADLGSPDITRYPGLLSPLQVRAGVLSELCIPVFSESRLIGTLNLESRHEYAYDVTSQIVSECAQVIGIAFLESRRRIGVELMYEAGGFLDRRHELERMVRELGADLESSVPDQGTTLSEQHQRQIRELLDHIYLHENMLRRHVDGDLQLSNVIQEAVDAVSWGIEIDLPLHVEGNNSQSVPLAGIKLSIDCAMALRFAIAQALVNVRKRGRNADAFAAWNSPIKVELLTRIIGGQVNLYFGISSFAARSAIVGLSGDTVFRQPLVVGTKERVRLGTYIAGEILRRCGGSAYFRTEKFSYAMVIVTSEFSVPISIDVTES